MFKIKNCKLCKKEFIITNRYYARQLYCSKDCSLVPINQYKKEYRNNSINKLKRNQYMRNYKKITKLKINARNSVQRDKLKNPENYPEECCICGETENIEFHHPDYNFPLSVYPLCKIHHVEIHQNEVKV